MKLKPFGERYVLVSFLIGNRVVKCRKMDETTAVESMKKWTRKGHRFRVTCSGEAVLTGSIESPSTQLR